MSHVRTELRASVTAALEAAIPDVTWQKAHWQVAGSGQLPLGGVGTPRTRNQMIDLSTSERAVDLLVVLKREGGADLEDDLDAESVVIERTVLPVLETVSYDFDLVETQFDGDASGEISVGTLSMLFRAVLQTETGNPD